LAWVEVHAETAHEKRMLERWKLQHKKLIGYLHDHQLELFGETPEAEAEEDIIPLKCSKQLIGSNATSSKSATLLTRPSQI
jgi:hypothetical protein